MKVEPPPACFQRGCHTHHATAESEIKKIAAEAVDRVVEVVWIAPVQNAPGLIAYECPSCSYVTSVLIGPRHAHGGARGDTSES